MKRVIFALFLSFSLLEAILPAKIGEFITKDKIDPFKLGIYITKENNGEEEVIASLNEDNLFHPASVAKLFTTYGALLEYGANFRWPTSLFYTGEVKNGILYGDLVIKAYGDPTLSCKDVEKIAKKIASLGIKEIKGDIIIDRTFFENSASITSNFDKNIYSQYNAMPDALMFDDHLCRIKLLPKKGKISIALPYPDKSLKIKNELKGVNRRCRGRYAYPKVAIGYEGVIPIVTFKGSYSLKCPPRTIRRVLTKPYLSFFYALKSYLNQYGVKNLSKLKLKPLPKNAKRLFIHRSKPLIEIVSITNKKSNNLYARHLFLILGTKYFGPPATLQKSREALRIIYQKRGIWDDRTFIDNGCGLSHKSVVSPKAILALLKDAKDNLGMRWLNTLSIAGVDGTTRRRFRHSAAKNRAWLKTGTLKRAKNIAGYVLSKNGNFYKVVIFYNGAKIWLAKLLQDQIIDYLAKE
ncbi:MAG: D-alanyl-D-alanine carboxypeptidase/D-alanyl-D-alanine-endopeptidase [Epsilonproteobacteria bacterium]|nr:D-alanyl-D-alanine carboxypeptidase/D-alanyl-D-alanine-endopeptidase [Campylobacterota bacterium]